MDSWSLEPGVGGVERRRLQLRPPVLRRRAVVNRRRKRHVHVRIRLEDARILLHPAPTRGSQRRRTRSNRWGGRGAYCWKPHVVRSEAACERQTCPSHTMSTGEEVPRHTAVVESIAHVFRSVIQNRRNKKHETRNKNQEPRNKR